MLEESHVGFTLYAPSGEALRRSDTLRGLIDHARRSPVCSFHLVRDVSPRVASLYPYAVQVFYEDGARGVTRFSDWRVAADWLAARRRSWGFVHVHGLPEFVARYGQRIAGRTP